MNSKTCSRCGGTWPISFFHLNGGTHKLSRHAPRAACMGCAKKGHSPDYAFVRKAANSLARHARQFRLSQAEFTASFAWDRQRMTADLHHALSGKCPYCQEPHTELRSLTFDIIDPAKPPHYSSNVRICCSSCNSTKHVLSPEAWAERIATWIRYREWIAETQKIPELGLPLFQTI